MQSSIIKNKNLITAVSDDRGLKIMFIGIIISAVAMVTLLIYTGFKFI
ncbi:MAG TPA: hypothetical protein VJ488_03285 [Dehalococcoidia bacterium]|nr:hypothetical protein [Dehalococcoidia bacterium]